MSIPLDGPAHFRVDNMPVVHNTTNPGSMLKKKSDAISYHFIHEGLASGIGRFGNEGSNSDQADMLTKYRQAQRDKELQVMYHFRGFPLVFLIRSVVPCVMLEKRLEQV
jgi:hypothetical protein